MPTIAEALATAKSFQQTGDLEPARQLYCQILQTNPTDADTWCLLGGVYQGLGRPVEATASFDAALRLRPDFAEAAAQRLCVLPGPSPPLVAFTTSQQVSPSRAESAEPHHRLGLAFLAQGRLSEAVASFEEALRLKPDHADACSNLGVALHSQGKFDDSVRTLELALRLRPDHAETLNNLGTALHSAGKLEEAVAALGQAMHLKPNLPEIYNNLGNTLRQQGKLEEAVASYQQALRLRPEWAEVARNLASPLAELGRLDEALAQFETAIRLKPGYADAHIGRAVIWLLLGRFDIGWPEFEWRWKCPGFSTRPPFPQPLWDGSPLEGRTILLHAEQGLGDTIQFVRYASLVKERGGRVVCECQKALLPLLARAPGIDQLVGAGAPLPHFDVHAPLLSLPRILGTTFANIPAQVPYLHADATLIEHWRNELSSLGGFKVGISWQGNPQYPHDRQRSVPLPQFAPLARLPGVHLVSLQKGPGEEQLRQIDFPITNLGSRLDQASGAFMDTAAVMRNVDLILTCNTAIAHLAGALAVPVWVALSHVPDWRWQLDRDDSPWYPTMRLFRQTSLGDWEGVFKRVVRELSKRLQLPARARAIRVEIAPGELIDKITILEIKSQRIADAAKLDNVRRELAVLLAERDAAIEPSAQLARLAAELKTVNENLWEIEDEIRGCERDRDFGPRFIELARSVYHQNDRRSALKRQINELLGSRLIEAKSYVDY